MLTIHPLISSYQKAIKPGEFLGRLLEPLLKLGLPFMKNAIKPLDKSVLIPLGLTLGCWNTQKMLQMLKTTLTISDDEMQGIMKLFQSLEDSGSLLKVVSELKNKKENFLVSC